MERRLPWDKQAARIAYGRRHRATVDVTDGDPAKTTRTRESTTGVRVIANAIVFADPRLKEYLQQILVVTRPERDGLLEASAFRPDTYSRIVEITGNVALLQLMQSAAAWFAVDRFASYMTRERAGKPPLLLVPDEALETIDGYGTSFARDWEEQPELVTIRRLIGLLSAEPRDATEIAREFLWAARPPDPHYLRVADSALAFIVLHECAHHLLNHTRRKNKDAIAPGGRVLADLMDAHEYDMDVGGLNGPQRKEAEADTRSPSYSCSACRARTPRGTTAPSTASEELSSPSRRSPSSKRREQPHPTRTRTNPRRTRASRTAHDVSSP